MLRSSSRDGKPREQRDNKVFSPQHHRKVKLRGFCRTDLKDKFYHL